MRCNTKQVQNVVERNHWDQAAPPPSRESPQQGWRHEEMGSRGKDTAAGLGGCETYQICVKVCEPLLQGSASLLGNNVDIPCLKVQCCTG